MVFLRNLVLEQMGVAHNLNVSHGLQNDGDRFLRLDG